MKRILLSIIVTSISFSLNAFYVTPRNRLGGGNSNNPIITIEVQEVPFWRNL